jgi:4-hydroxy-2-oxoheptanedioate aldolase
MTGEALVTLAMIETKAGLENLEHILAVEGLDGVFVGPSDLAIALGREPLADPTDSVVVAAIEHVSRRAHDAGKRAGIFCGSVAAAHARLAQGFALVSLGTDLQMLADAARKGLRQLRR